MSIEAIDIKMRKSVTVTDTSANGGRKGQVLVVSGAKHNLFPRVTAAERVAGVTRYRKEFWSNEDPDDATGFDVLQFLEFPSNGGDRFYLGKGSQLDTQGDLPTTPPLWTGAGWLNAALSGGEAAIDLLMESDDFEFAPAGVLHISDKVQTGQTIAAGVNVGDSVEDIAGTWTKIAADTDIAHPKGIYLGSNRVLSEEAPFNEEFLDLDEKKTTDEVIATGDGGTTQVVLTDLAVVTNGLVVQNGYKPVITVLSGAVLRTVHIEEDGTCSGYCSAGEINPDTGVWVTDIDWTTAPDNLEDIEITYYDKNYSYAGNVVTLELDGTVSNAFTTAKTIGSGCLKTDEVVPTSDNWDEISAAGTYDESTYPVIQHNDGSEEDTWTLTFTSATAFTCAGLYNGAVGSGVITGDFSPTNPNSGQPYFTIDKDGWGGTWIAGNTVVFQTHPGAVPIWWKEVVPAATSEEPDNLAILGWYTE